MAESHKTRSHTELFLIGHPKILEDGGKLPLAKDVIQHLKYCQLLPGNSNLPVKSLICCPLITKQKTANCSGPNGCISENSPIKGRCVVNAVSEFWKRAGIPTICDQNIATHVHKLLDRWTALKKNSKKNSPVDVAKREQFQGELNQLFDIATPSAISTLQVDRLRSLRQAKKTLISILTRMVLDWDHCHS